MELDGTRVRVLSLPRLIEVKTTNGWERTPFYITRNELEVADARRQEWSLVRLFDFSREVRAFELRPQVVPVPGGAGGAVVEEDARRVRR